MAYCSRCDRLRYEPAMVRYCDTDATKKLNCLSPSTSANEIWVPPNRSPPLVTPTFRGGRPGRVDGRRREHQRVVVEELRRRVVVRAERQLRLGAGRQIEAENLVVAADARQVDEELAVRRHRRGIVGEVVLRQVGQR